MTMTHETMSMNSRAPASPPYPNTLRLDAANSIRECAALKQTLLPLLQAHDPVEIDVTKVEQVDTAALQLLFAFCRDRKANGLTVVWQGESAAWRRALAILDPTAGATGASTNF